MALDAGFMAALMKIPYFNELVERNGEEWLESVFRTLETESYDFSRFDPFVPDSVSLSIDEAIALDLADLDVETPEIATTSVTTEAVAAKVLSTDDDKHETRSQAAEQVAAAMAAKAPEVAAASDQATNEKDGVPEFDNAERENAPLVEHNSETIRRHLADWLAMFNPDTGYSAHQAEEAVVVGLNGLYDDLKLTAFDDKIYTANGSNDATVNAGDGSDTLYLTTGGLKADLGGTSDFGRNGGKVVLRSVENVVGSDGNDTIAGNGEANKLSGRGGNDKIEGGGGDDTITGGGGDNTLSGGTGNDTITGGNSDDTIDGGGGADTIKSGNGDDDVSGGSGTDTIDTGSGADKIDGGDDVDTITAGAGDDDIAGGEGNDTIKADAGKDTVDGGAGNDTVNGGDDDDKITGADGDDTLNGDAGNDTVEGGKGVDTVHGNDGNDTVKGDDGADKLFGDAGNDTIDGGADADDINGGDGDDVLLGGAGKDKIDGGPGADKITGGAGADTLMGGTGADTYIYLAKDDSGTAADTFDIITDFDATTDKFDLTALLTSDTFDFVAAEGGAFTGTGPEVRWDKDGAKTFVEIDVDGNGTADMKIELDDAVDLTATNFNL